jgi:hypothetical protein
MDDIRSNGKSIEMVRLLMTIGIIDPIECDMDMNMDMKSNNHLESLVQKDENDDELEAKEVAEKESKPKRQKLSVTSQRKSKVARLDLFKKKVSSQPVKSSIITTKDPLYQHAWISSKGRFPRNDPIK